MFDETKFYSTREVEDAKRIPGHQIRRLIREGKIPAKRLPGGRSYFIKGDDANRLLAD